MMEAASIQQSVVAGDKEAPWVKEDNGIDCGGCISVCPPKGAIEIRVT